MDAETVNAIAALSRQADRGELTYGLDLDGTVYSFGVNATENGRQLGPIITPPAVTALNVTTLTGFVNAIEMGGYEAEEYGIHVEDYLTVALKDRSPDRWGKRHTHILARHTPFDAFRFDNYYSDLARFIIALQVSFLTTEELLYVIKLASNLKAGNSVTVQDDGFSQTVTLRAGEVSTAEVKVKPRIKLIPLRTFPEAAPVESEYLIRFQQNDKQMPSIALFDCDGKKWQGELMGSIKKWLMGVVDPQFPIIA